eukprot:1356703-Rhodomonas_salina.1
MVHGMRKKGRGEPHLATRSTQRTAALNAEHHTLVRWYRQAYHAAHHPCSTTAKASSTARAPSPSPPHPRIVSAGSHAPLGPASIVSAQRRAVAAAGALTHHSTAAMRVSRSSQPPLWSSRKRTLLPAASSRSPYPPPPYCPSNPTCPPPPAHSSLYTHALSLSSPARSAALFSVDAEKVRGQYAPPAGHSPSRSTCESMLATHTASPAGTCVRVVPAAMSGAATFNPGANAQALPRTSQHICFLVVPEGARQGERGSKERGWEGHLSDGVCELRTGDVLGGDEEVACRAVGGRGKRRPPGSPTRQVSAPNKHCVAVAGLEPSGAHQVRVRKLEHPASSLHPSAHSLAVSVARVVVVYRRICHEGSALERELVSKQAPWSSLSTPHNLSEQAWPELFFCRSVIPTRRRWPRLPSDSTYALPTCAKTGCC